MLLRAVEIARGIEVDDRSPRRTRRDVADGPGKLCQAFGIERSFDGTDLCAGGPVTIVDDGVPSPTTIVTTPRIGITVAVDQPWRWVLPLESGG